MVVTVKMKNLEQLLSRKTAPDRQHHFTLIMGDSDNRVVFLQRLT